MTSAEIQREILLALRGDAHGLDQFQIAADICQAPFRVRAELKAMRREQLVRDEIHRDALLWKLTARGYDRAYSGDQLTLGGRR